MIKLVVGNWKMNGRADENKLLLGAISGQLERSAADVEAAVCIPFPYLAQAEAVLDTSRISWGIQDVSAQLNGAFTGEVSAMMAADFGCTYAIVGHSERRKNHCETSTLIAQKSRRAIEHGLVPIICIGESREQREAGATERVVFRQVQDVFDLLSLDEARRTVIAYEPVWAIGTGKTARPQEAQEVHEHIRELLISRDSSLCNVKLLYGGSVKSENAADLFEQPDIDGALVGGASLDPDEFVRICRAASTTREETDAKV